MRGREDAGGGVVAIVSDERSSAGDSGRFYKLAATKKSILLTLVVSASCAVAIDFV